MKNLNCVVIGLLSAIGVLLLFGASAPRFPDARYDLVFGTITKRFNELGAGQKRGEQIKEFPACFRIDRVTGKIWYLRIEDRLIIGSNAKHLEHCSGFVLMPFETSPRVLAEDPNTGGFTIPLDDFDFDFAL